MLLCFMVQIGGLICTRMTRALPGLPVTTPLVKINKMPRALP